MNETKLDIVWKKVQNFIVPLKTPAFPFKI